MPGENLRILFGSLRQALNCATLGARIGGIASLRQSSTMVNVDGLRAFEHEYLIIIAATIPRDAGIFGAFGNAPASFGIKARLSHCQAVYF
jgi:hypothetical protein